MSHRPHCPSWRTLLSLTVLAAASGVAYSADPGVPPSGDLTLDVKRNEGRVAVSKWVYGRNARLIEQEVSPDLNPTWYRLGGNTAETLNWEQGFANAGADYINNNSLYLANYRNLGPGGVPKEFINLSRQRGAGTLMAVSMQNWVSADANGQVYSGESLNARFNQNRIWKGSALTTNPEVNDDYVYQDEFVNFLNSTFPGYASNTATPLWLALDNEPELWHHAHPLLNTKQTIAGYLDRVKTTANMVKSMNSGAFTLAPTCAEWWMLHTFNEASDRNGRDFANVFLQEMKAASDAAGRRLVDSFDNHWYPEALGNEWDQYGNQLNIVFSYGNAKHDSAGMWSERMNAPRSLWQDGYKENHPNARDMTGGRGFRAIPDTLERIAANWPGTKMSYSEWAFGGPDHFTGGIAAADTIGIMGREGVFMAANWPFGGNTFYDAALKLYRNYDGLWTSVGDTQVKCTLSNNADYSAYAFDSTSGNRSWVVLINKNSSAKRASIRLWHDKNLPYVQSWRIAQDSAKIQWAGQTTLSTNNALAYDLPGYSVNLLVFTNFTDEKSESGTGNGLKADYFRNTDFTNPWLTRTEQNIDANWDYFRPDGTFVADADRGNNKFSVRWTGQVQPRFSETYTFEAVADDGVRLWVNGQQLINQWWQVAEPSTKGTAITLTAGTKYDIAMEYKSEGYDSVSRLLWSSPSQRREAVSPYRLYSPPISTDTVSNLSAPAAVVQGATAQLSVNYTTTSNDRRLGGMLFSVANKGGSNEAWTYQSGDFPAVTGSGSKTLNITAPAAAPVGDAAWLVKLQNGAGTTDYSQVSAYGRVNVAVTENLSGLSAASAVVPGGTYSVSVNYTTAASDRRIGVMFFSTNGGTWTYQTGDFAAVSGSGTRTVNITLPSSCPTGSGSWLVKLQNAAGTTDYKEVSATAMVSAADNARYHFESSDQGWTKWYGNISSTGVSTAQKKNGLQSLRFSLSQASGDAGSAVALQNPPAEVAGKTVTFQVYVPNSAAIYAIQPFAYASSTNTWNGTYTTAITKGAWNQITLAVPAGKTWTQLGVEVKANGAVTGDGYVDSVTW